MVESGGDAVLHLSLNQDVQKKEGTIAVPFSFVIGLE